MSVITRQDLPIPPLGFTQLALFVKRERFPEFPRQLTAIIENRPTLSHSSLSVPNFQEVSTERFVLAGASKRDLRYNAPRRRKTLHTRRAGAADESQRQRAEDLPEIPQLSGIVHHSPRHGSERRSCWSLALYPDRISTGDSVRNSVNLYRWPS